MCKMLKHEEKQQVEGRHKYSNYEQETVRRLALTGTYFTRTSTSVAFCIECRKNSNSTVRCEQLLLTQLETHIILLASKS
jgi:hypothetical protein